MVQHVGGAVNAGTPAHRCSNGNRGAALEQECGGEEETTKGRGSRRRTAASGDGTMADLAQEVHTTAMGGVREEAMQASGNSARCRVAGRLAQAGQYNSGERGKGAAR